LINKPPCSTCRRKQHPCDSNRHERKRFVRLAAHRAVGLHGAPG
jgi:hypothetical protein